MAAHTESELREELNRFEWHGIVIPEHCREGLIRYVAHGLPPGNFLLAVLSNDLREAFACADRENSAAMGAWVGFLYNHCPGLCWGSPEKVKDWIDLARKSR